MKKKLLPQAISISLITLGSSAAYAAGNADNWTGYNMQLGIAHTNLDDDKKDIIFGQEDDCCGPDHAYADLINISDDDSNTSGFVSIGRDFKIADSSLLGVFGEFGFGGAESKLSGLVDDGSYDYFLTDVTKIKHSISLGAKLSHAYSDKFSLFLTGGVSLSKIERKTSVRLVSSGTQEYDLSARESDYEPGPFIGVGGEYRFTKNASVALEYRYTDYGKLNKASTYNGNSYSEGVYINQVGTSAGTLDTDVSTDSLKLAFVYRF